MLNIRKCAKATENAEGTGPSQTATLQAILFLKTKCPAKMDEEAKTQNTELCKQINILRWGITAAIDLANARANAA